MYGFFRQQTATDITTAELGKAVVQPGRDVAELNQQVRYHNINDMI